MTLPKRNFRFHEFHCESAKMLILASLVICYEILKDDIDISPILEEFEINLSNNEINNQEILFW